MTKDQEIRLYEFMAKMANLQFSFTNPTPYEIREFNHIVTQEISKVIDKVNK